MATLYETDFYTWTQDQAARLRRLQVADNGLDIPHLAEEVADLGRSELNRVRSLLTQVLVHYLKAAIDAESQAQAHWRSEAVVFQNDAVETFTPGMRQAIDVARLYDRAVKLLRRQLAPYGIEPGPLPACCPLDLDALLAADFDDAAAFEACRDALAQSRA